MTCTFRAKPLRYWAVAYPIDLTERWRHSASFRSCLALQRSGLLLVSQFCSFMQFGPLICVWNLHWYCLGKTQTGYSLLHFWNTKEKQIRYLRSIDKSLQIANVFVKFIIGIHPLGFFLSTLTFCGTQLCSIFSSVMCIILLNDQIKCKLEFECLQTLARICS